MSRRHKEPVVDRTIMLRYQRGERKIDPERNRGNRTSILEKLIGEDEENDE